MVVASPRQMETGNLRAVCVLFTALRETINDLQVIRGLHVIETALLLAFDSQTLPPFLIQIIFMT